jgi:hypothetical protein
MMVKLRSFYRYHPSPDEWALSVASYFEGFQQYGDDLIGRTFARATKEYPSNFPTFGELMIILKAEQMSDRAKVRAIEEPRPEGAYGLEMCSQIIGDLSDGMEMPGQREANLQRKVQKEMERDPADVINAIAENYMLPPVTSEQAKKILAKCPDIPRLRDAMCWVCENTKHSSWAAVAEHLGV